MTLIAVGSQRGFGVFAVRSGTNTLFVWPVKDHMIQISSKSNHSASQKYVKGGAAPLVELPRYAGRSTAQSSTPCQVLVKSFFRKFEMLIIILGSTYPVNRKQGWTLTAAWSRPVVSGRRYLENFMWYNHNFPTENKTNSLIFR